MPCSELSYRVAAVIHRVGIRKLRHKASALDQLIAEGRASEADGDLLELMDELQLPAPADRGKRRPSAALAQLRADAR